MALKKIRVLIADDHKAFRSGLRAWMNQKPEFQVVGEAKDGNETIVKASQLQPDIILLDLKMPKKDGLIVLREMIRQNPATCVLILTNNDERKKATEALQAGCCGYLHKANSPWKLEEAIRAILSGEIYLDSTLNS